MRTKDGNSMFSSCWTFKIRPVFKCPLLHLHDLQPFPPRVSLPEYYLQSVKKSCTTAVSSFFFSAKQWISVSQ